jgi:cytochrome c oxidase accessory protein FixG
MAVAGADDSSRLFSNYAAHEKVYPRAVTGRYARLRWAAVILTQLVYYGLPWMQWNGRQAVLFDLGTRKFYLFGIVLWPQDFVYLAVLLVIAALSLFFFTALAGRVWCGFACPQTVYTELFMWIERRLEGDRIQRMKLDARPLSLTKLRIKTTKHMLWAALSLWTGLTFIGYFEPIRELGVQIASLSLGPWQWFWWLFYSFATWGNAGFMREQVCKYMCPYARFQSAMFDRDTMIVTYDQQRGDPRGSRSRKADPASLGLGDCVDCTLCVQVCPTGIDIREGLQYECIGCAACVDVCNDVMHKMNYQPGLIRFSTENAIKLHVDSRQLMRRTLRPRVLIYGVILLALLGALLGSLALRSPLNVDVIRDRYSLARILEDGSIENTYRLQLMNASERPLSLQIDVAGIDSIRLSGAERFEVPAAANRVIPVSVRISPPDGNSRSIAGSNPIRFIIREPTPDGLTHEEKAVFLVPR